MGARRTLFDLFKPGTICKIDDGSDDPIEVWVQKVSPDQQDLCIRRADAARARVLLTYKDADAEQRLAAMSDALDFDRSVMVDTLLVREAEHQRASIAAELEFGEGDDGEPTEWGKDNYLEGLRTLWDERVMEQWKGDGEDPEATRILAEFRRFEEQVQHRFDRALDDLRAEYLGRTDDDLRDAVVEQMIEQRSTMAWLDEYSRARVYYSTRLAENHRAFYFSEVGIDGLRDLSKEVLEALDQAYAEIGVDPGEGKDSPRTGDSSPSSEEPEAPETSGSSDSKIPVSL